MKLGSSFYLFHVHLIGDNRPLRAQPQQIATALASSPLFILRPFVCMAE